MPLRTDPFLCNTMMKSHLSSRQFLESIRLYARLRRKEGFVPDNYTFATLAKCCGLNFSTWAAMGVHGHVIKYGFMSNLYVATAIVDMYGKLGRIASAQVVFEEMPERSSVSWTALVTGYIRTGDMCTARAIFDKMPEKERDTAAFNVMIDGCVKLGEMAVAKTLFDATPEKNVVSWTTMIDGYCGIGNNKKPHEAVVLFEKLLDGKFFEPDDVTVVSVLPAIADLGVLDLGDRVYEFAKSKKLDRSANVSTALVDMYAKCGEVEKSRRVFDGVLKRETCTWNALINGLAINGCASDALRVFDEMMRNGFKPDEITMLGVLSACNHGGLVEEGKTYFGKMGVLKITLKIEHYGCLVDLLGRAGCLEEAEKLIESMPYEANGIILSSLLFACGYAKDVARAEKVVEKAISMEPCNDGNYVILRNLYAGERRWRDVERVKKLMVTKGAKKEVGCSAIEIDGRFLEFIAGENVNPCVEVTRWVLDQLRMHMKVWDPVLDVDCRASEA
ncbi:pentatricopeptide repeat-containing protein at2g44880 [Phtheirospermum japonicum]|uniref:Pentatricopeptide repeat-containing protein at2g44880 n=1 Tax=Phtheirospermum japonicum TaxID=374723 RepID=A0A830BWI4_9LAMI|nr:pentatricopeptide repeat-containing protein at2g44880 [Phtheirospermum japonicum]